MKPLRWNWEELAAAYATGATNPADTVRSALARITADGVQPVWISIFDRETLLHRARHLEELRAAAGSNWQTRFPLWGIPFAVKDNIDVAGLPTTAACPAFSHHPSESAEVVRRLETAGAIVIGKTNLDQFATGLVGVRSPYGVCRNPYNTEYLAGGSSSGSAVAVAAGHVCFALGTDTAGSGRVPAGFCGLVGYKPTVGLLSTRGVVPACRTLDCVSIFASTTAEARRVAQAAAGFDTMDAFSRSEAARFSWAPAAADAGPFKFGVPRMEQLEFFGDAAHAECYRNALSRLEAIGGERVEIDFAPFRETAALLYAGPWVAERFAVVEKILREQPDALLPVTRSIIEAGRSFSAIDTFRSLYRLADLRRAAQQQLAFVDFLVLPTTPTHPSIAAVEAEPVKINTQLGTYTNFVNLLDLAGIAVPAGSRPDGLPFGITLLAPSWSDARLMACAQRFLDEPTWGGDGTTTDEILLAVVGAHLSGQPLNYQLTRLGARLVRSVRTSDAYRLYALAGTVPPKPGLARVRPGFGAGIEAEIWAIGPAGFGRFVAAIPPPLGIGTVTIDDGSTVKGFICEPAALTHAEDITHWRSWRAFLARPEAAVR